MSKKKPEAEPRYDTLTAETASGPLEVPLRLPLTDEETAIGFAMLEMLIPHEKDEVVMPDFANAFLKKQGVHFGMRDDGVTFVVMDEDGNSYEENRINTDNLTPDQLAALRDGSDKQGAMHVELIAAIVAALCWHEWHQLPVEIDPSDAITEEEMKMIAAFVPICTHCLEHDFRTTQALAKDLPEGYTLIEQTQDTITLQVGDIQFELSDADIAMGFTSDENGPKGQ